MFLFLYVCVSYSNINVCIMLNINGSSSQNFSFCLYAHSSLYQWIILYDIEFATEKFKVEIILTTPIHMNMQNIIYTYIKIIK